MVKINFIILFICLWGQVLNAQRINISDTITFSGVIFNTETERPMGDVNCRRGKTGTISNQAGQFVLYALRGDTVCFSFVGFKSYKVIVPDSLYGQEYILGVFMSPDTISLSEAVILPRVDMNRKMRMNARNNMAGVMKSAFAPVKEMDASMSQKMMIDKFARSVEMRGHVDVGLGVGTQSIDAYRQLRFQKKLKDQPIWLENDEVDLLKKIYYIEKRENKDN